MFGLPAGVTLKDFKSALRHVLKNKEPFLFACAVDDDRAGRVEMVKSLPASVRYDADAMKKPTRRPRTLSVKLAPNN